MSLASDPPPATDIVFFRNTGIVLVLLAALAGSITVTATFKSVEITPAIDLARSTESMPLELYLPQSGTRQTQSNDYMQPRLSAGARI